MELAQWSSQILSALQSFWWMLLCWVILVHMANFMCNNFIRARYQSSNKLHTHLSKRWDSSTQSIFIYMYDHCICVINFIHVGSREWIQSGFCWVRRRYHCGELQHNAPSQNQTTSVHKSSSRECMDYLISDQKVDLDSGQQSGFFQFKQ
jgi:hypothetical protein